MNYTAREHEEAVSKLQYIESVKHALCTLLNYLSDYAQSGMNISPCSYRLAEALIQEALDEMYYEDVIKARYIQGTFYQPPNV